MKQQIVGVAIVGAISVLAVCAIGCSSLSLDAQIRHHLKPNDVSGSRLHQRDVQKVTEESSPSSLADEESSPSSLAEGRRLLNQYSQKKYLTALRADEVDPSLVSSALDNVLTLGDDSLFYSEVTIQEPIKIIKKLQQLQKDIAWGILGENYTKIKENLRHPNQTETSTQNQTKTNE